MNEQDDETLLNSAVDNLPRELKPHRDLWPGIEHAIESRGTDRKFSVNAAIFAAATVVFAVAITWTLPQFSNTNNTAFHEFSMAMLVEDMDRGFEIQKASMLTVYKGKTSLTENWQDQLEELENARNGIRQALMKNPNNVYMIQFLHNIHQQQLEIIESVHTQINHNI